MQNETEIAGGVGTNECGTVHDASDVFEALREFDVIDDRVDLGKGAKDLISFEAGLKGGVAFGIESFSVGHAASHPKNDDGVGRGCNFFLSFGEDLAVGEDLTREAGAESGERSGAGGFKKVATCHNKFQS